MAWFEQSALKDGVARREVVGWALFDAANSGYSTVVLTAVFNVYFVDVICAGASWATLFWSATVAAANAAGILLMPLIGRMADARASKKRWLVAATLLCIGATAGLSLTGPGTITLAATLVVVSYFAFNVGETLNSAFLPEIAREESVGKVSGWGWSLGYVGGLVTLGVCLIWLLGGRELGYTDAVLVPGTNIITAVIFLVVALPVFLWTQERAVPTRDVRIIDFVRESRAELKASWRSLPQYQDFFRLVICGFFYQCGIATVITLAAIYASAEMGFSMVQTLILVLVVNVTAAIGAFVFGYVQDAIGHKKALAATLVIWVGMVVLASVAQKETFWGLVLFWISANLAGLAMGSSQSAGRAMVAVFAPPKRLAEFYGLWNMALWLSAIVGPMTYGAVTWLTANNHRAAFMITGLFFVVALILVGSINVERGERRAKEPD